MPFTISALSEDGTVLVQQDTAARAFDTATLLKAEGKLGIVITDSSGQVYDPAEFERLFVIDRS